MLERNRWSRGSADVQTEQRQPIIGTPLLVPVPRNVMLNDGATTSTIRRPRCPLVEREHLRTIYEDLRADARAESPTEESVPARY